MIGVRGMALHANDFALNGIDLNIATGQYAVLMGNSGAGKTTILEAICGLRPINKGTIVIGDRDVTRLSPSERNIGYVPQDLALFPMMTVRAHLEFASRLRGRSAPRVMETTKSLAGRLSILHLLDRKPAKLSGGESQRVALGRALSFDPDALLLDEPLSALDESTRSELQSLLRSINRETGVTILHVTHDSAEAKAVADVRFRLVNGQITSDSDDGELNSPASDFRALPD